MNACALRCARCVQVVDALLLRALPAAIYTAFVYPLVGLARCAGNARPVQATRGGPRQARRFLTLANSRGAWVKQKHSCCGRTTGALT